MPRQDSVTGQSMHSGHGPTASTSSNIALWAGEYQGCDLNIRFRNRDGIRACCFQFYPSHCLFKDDAGRIVLEQRFIRELPDHPIRPWTHARNGPSVVTFTPDYAQGFKLIQDGATIQEIPKFEFVGGRGYAEFQTQLRGKAFIHEFITKKIDPKNNDDVKNEQHAIKVWEGIRDGHERSLSVPITHKSLQLGFLDLKLKWFGLKVVNPDKIRLELHAPRVETTPPGPSILKFRRRSTVLSMVPRALKTSPRLEPASIESISDLDAAPTHIRTRYTHLEITFNCPTDCKYFQDLHAGGFSSRQLNVGLGIVVGEPSRLSSSPQSRMSSAPPPHPTIRPNSAFSSILEPSSPISADISHSSPPLPSTLPTSASTRPLSSADPSSAPVIRLPDSMPSPLFSGIRISDILDDPDTEILRPGGVRPVEAAQTSGFFVQNEGIYDTLTASEIRLLRIKKGVYEDPLSCTLQHYSLTNTPSYEAVSYCWGEISKPNSIMIGRKQSFQVTEHLWEGLRRLRFEEKDRLVWIDAVCINQADNHEKNLQIPLMRRIYRNAQRTLIWIGNLHMERENCQRHLWAEKDNHETDHQTLCTRAGADELVHAYADLEELLQSFKQAVKGSGSLNVWWKRLWVIQEYHFSAKPPIVYFGSHSVDWHYFDRKLCGSSESDDPLAPFRQLGTFENASVTSESRPLFDLLCLARNFHCVNGRDRVYGLLSMHYSEQQQIRPDVRKIQPDYGKSVLQVLEETCEYLVAEFQSVDVLLDRRVDRNLWGPDRLAGVVPTWVPDFTLLIPRESWRPDERAAGTGQGRKQANVQLITVVSNFNGLHAPRILRVRGIRFERIVRRTTREDFLDFEKVPSGRLIYSSLERRGRLLGRILDILQYSCDSFTKFDKLERRPYLSYLMLGYVFEDKRSLVAELKTKIKARSIDLTWKYKEQRERDMAYVQSSNDTDITTASTRRRDMEYVSERWRVKLDRATQAMWIPDRLQALLDDPTRNDHNSIRDDFKMAREFENLFAYARTTQERYYFTTTDFDAPMRADVLRCRTDDEVYNLTRNETLPEFHEYSEHNRQRDFFITEGGFIGLGTCMLEVDDIIVVPLGSGSPWILREHKVGDMMYYKVIGEAVVPSIMTGALLTQKGASEEDFQLV